MNTEILTFGHEEAEVRAHVAQLQADGISVIAAYAGRTPGYDGTARGVIIVAGEVAPLPTHDGRHRLAKSRPCAATEYGFGGELSVLIVGRWA